MRQLPSFFATAKAPCKNDQSNKAVLDNRLLAPSQNDVPNYNPQSAGEGVPPIAIVISSTAEKEKMPISIDSGVTDEKWLIIYDNREVQVEASKRRFFHVLVTRDREGFGSNHPYDVFFRVLNELVWFSDIEVDDLNGGHGEYSANLNFRASDDSYLIQLERFRQQVTTVEQHLALGFFREALSSGSPFYQFMCYAKILEIPFGNGNAKGVWIDEAIDGLHGDLAVTVRDRKIAMLGVKSLGKWLHEDGRNAISHAKIRTGEFVRDPNSFKDWDEIKWGNTVMRELAEKILVEELQVPVGAAATTYLYTKCRTIRRS